MIPTIERTPLDGSSAFQPRPEHDRGVAIAPALRDAFVASGNGEQNLARLFSEGALCVTTGQQPGLFTGPLLTIHKALSAIALARRCEAALARPVVPVFWVAGDDHDFAESNHCHLIDQRGELQRIVLRERDAAAPSTPMYRELLGDDVERALAAVMEATPDTEFRQARLDWLEAHYQSDRTMAEAFAGALADLLGDFGLVVFRPTHEAAKAAMVPVVRGALEGAETLTAILSDRSRELEKTGESIRVPVRKGETLVMIEGAEGRDRLLIENDIVVSRRAQEQWARDEAITLLEEDPSRFSPNVLLRPVAEAAILPTIALVVGPGERRYLAQAEVLYDALEVARQQVVTRWSGQVIESRIARTLSKYGISADDLQLPEGQLEGRLASDELPDAAGNAMQAIRSTLDEQYRQLIASAVSIDPTLEKPVKAAQHRSLSELANVEKRMISHLKKQDEVRIRQIAAARTALFPGLQPQERVLNVMQYLVRYSGDYLFGVLAACEEWASGHARHD